jgi:transcriptional regulator with XRE-family HTH domain
MFWDVFCKECDKISKKPNKVAIELGLSSATTTKWKAGAVPNGETLAKIADYFSCSVDYLLGRTNEPNSEIHQNITAGANNSESNNISVGVKTEENFTEPTDSMTRKFIDVFVHLEFSQQVNVMKYALEQAEKNA